MSLTMHSKNGGPGNRITPDKIEEAMRAVESRRAAAEKRAEGQGPLRHGLARAVHMQSAEIFFDPQRFLLGTCLSAAQEAKRSGLLALLSCSSQGRTIVIDEHRGVVQTNMTTSQLRTLAIVPYGEGQTEVPVVDYLDVRAAHNRIGAGLRLIGREEFFWHLGLLTSRGRIPAGTDMDKPVRLRRWPNLTRLTAPPGTMRIVAHWLQQPCTLTGLAAKLNLRAEDLFSLYTAASAAGLAAYAGSAPVAREGAPLAPHGKRGLLVSILERLGKRQLAADAGGRP